MKIQTHFLNPQNNIIKRQKSFGNNNPEFHNPDLKLIADIVEEDQFMRTPINLPSQYQTKPKILKPISPYENSKYQELLSRLDKSKDLIQDDIIEEYTDFVIADIISKWTKSTNSISDKRHRLYASIDYVKHLINAYNELNENYRTNIYTTVTPSYIKINDLPPKDTLSVMEIPPHDYAGDVLYEKYYVTPLHVPPRTKYNLVETEKKAGIKVYTTKQYGEQNALDNILQEINNWQKVIPPQYKLPRAIVATTLTPTIAAYITSDNEHIYLDSQNCLAYPPALRHELIHIVDKSQEHKINYKNTNFVHYIKTSNKAQLKILHICNDIRTKWEKDGLNSIYAKELRNAGINDFHIEYAHQNRREFIAIAGSAPDTTKFSNEFKAILSTIGLPKFVLELPKLEHRND